MVLVRVRIGDVVVSLTGISDESARVGIALVLLWLVMAIVLQIGGIERIKSVLECVWVEIAIVVNVPV